MELSFKPSSYTLNAAPVAALHSLPADWWRGGRGLVCGGDFEEGKNIKFNTGGDQQKKEEEEL